MTAYTTIIIPSPQPPTKKHKGVFVWLLLHRGVRLDLGLLKRGVRLVLLTPQGCLFGVVSSRRRGVSVFCSQPNGRLFLGLTAQKGCLFLGLTAPKGVFVYGVNSPKGVFVSRDSSPKQGVFVLGAAATRVRLYGLAPHGSVWSVGLLAPLLCVHLCGVSIEKCVFGLLLTATWGGLVCDPPETGAFGLGSHRKGALGCNSHH
uniref:Uncharacterized protein n=1 Tax=Tanacetum cinerariifolium TaxID=118510 RepID=A0A699TB02_TANCI|nr:hypothetical protein [Tanacetum cinerariifolium]